MAMDAQRIPWRAVRGVSGLLRRCVETKIKTFTEYYSAQAEVEGLLTGIRFELVPADLRAVLPLNAAVGVYVRGVLAGGPAESAGVKTRDVLSFINDQPATLERMRTLCERGKFGDRMRLRILRPGEMKGLTVRLGDWK